MKKEDPIPKPTSPPKQTEAQKPDTTLTDTTDKQVLREFLSGVYCFQGVSTVCCGSRGDNDDMRFRKMMIPFQYITTLFHVVLV